jgi:hypothetical protein
LEIDTSCRNVCFLLIKTSTRFFLAFVYPSRRDPIVGWLAKLELAEGMGHRCHITSVVSVGGESEGGEFPI